MIFDWSVDWGYVWEFFRNLIINGFLCLFFLGIAACLLSVVIAGIVNTIGQGGE